MFFLQLLLFLSSQLRQHLFQGACPDPSVWVSGVLMLPWLPVEEVEEVEEGKFVQRVWVPRSRALGSQQPLVTVDLASLH